MSTTDHITLSRLQQLVRQGIESVLPLPVWVSAEVSDIKVNRSGHCYLELIEKGESDAIPRAKASAVVWRNRWEALAVWFASSTGAPLGVGMKVLVRVSPSYHELYGFSLVISDIDPTYTLGDMQAQRQQTIDSLRADGVWDMNRECAMPTVCQRLAVVSSATAAGYRDFCNELGAYPYRFDVTLFEAVVQGHGAEESITAALSAVADRYEEFDAVVIIRGGGSTTDLACFNSYMVCSYIAQFPLPVVTGIGHDKDQSVADMVAHTALKTPTAVADFLGSQAAEVDARLVELDRLLRVSVENALNTERTRLTVASHATSEGCARVARDVEVRLQSLGERVALLSKEILTRQGERLERYDEGLRSTSAVLMERFASQLDSLAGVVAANDPQRILSHGFSIVRIGGKTLKSVEQAQKGETAEVSLADGTMNVKITDIWKKS
ncbi:MAG: exodeoxyribonuclease VII large subunit [Rikenellaceae bacterium]|nr:exodeoxyribonuclease VII large subunit [Rikenellaceae bacterium]